MKKTHRHTQTHAANPADNVEFISEPLTYFRRRSLISIETSIESKSNAGVHIASMPLANEKHAELFCSAPRLKSERDSAQAHFKLAHEELLKLREINAELVTVVNLHLTFLASLEKGWLGKHCADIGALNEAYIQGGKALDKSALLVAHIEKSAKP